MRLYNGLVEAAKLTPSQAAEILEISTRTLRRWSIEFENALSPSASRKGQKRFYDGEDIATLQRAKRLMKNEGMSIAETARVLPIRTAQEEILPLVLAPEQNIALGTAIERTRQLTDDVTDIKERIRMIEEWSRLPWWKRIFKKPF